MLSHYLGPGRLAALERWLSNTCSDHLRLGSKCTANTYLHCSLVIYCTQWPCLQDCNGWQQIEMPMCRRTLCSMHGVGGTSNQDAPTQ